MNCVKCGKEIPDGRKFCKFCGAPQMHVEEVNHKKKIYPRAETVHEEYAKPQVHIPSVMAARFKTGILFLLGIGMLISAWGLSAGWDAIMNLFN